MLAMYMYSFFPVYCTLWVLTWANLPASTAIEPRVCGTRPPSKELLVAHRELLSTHRQLKARDQPSETVQAQIVIDTYIHFVTTKDQAPFYSANFLSYAYDNQVCLFLPSYLLGPFHLSLICKSGPKIPQLSVLNNAYSPAKISFRLLAPTYTINDSWATDPESQAMKSTLRRGSYSALNLYFQTNLTNPSALPRNPDNILLGSCTLPTTVTYVPDFCPSPPCAPISFPASVYTFDGCSIRASTLPGGFFRGYNKGGTAVHEIGHWFGLLHTFQGENCSFGNSGDYIDDTPLEAASTSGCPVWKDSCPLEPGVDPIHNYMDYSSDAWWDSDIFLFLSTHRKSTMSSRLFR